MGKIVCPSCGEELDKVVLSFGTRSWSEGTQSYIHTEDDDEGDWQCPKCGTTVSETRFYPPEHDLPDRPYSETSFDYTKAAEFIAQNVTTIVPEYAGEQLAESEATIDSWLRGEERSAALRKRQAAREWLRTTAERHGYRG